MSNIFMFLFDCPYNHVSLSLQSSQLVCIHPLDKASHHCHLGGVQQQELLTLPALTWFGPALQETAGKPDQLVFKNNCGR